MKYNSKGEHVDSIWRVFGNEKSTYNKKPNLDDTLYAHPYIINKVKKRRGIINEPSNKIKAKYIHLVDLKIL